MRKLSTGLLSFLFVPLVLVFAQSASASSKIKIVTTLFPFYEFAREVAGGSAEVALLLPPGVEPHAYDPTPGDISRINDADMFIYTGGAMEPWVQRLLPGVTNQNLQIIDASQGVKINESGFTASADTEKRENVDPHIWMDFKNDLTIVDRIAEALIERDGDHKKEYLANADAYKAKLMALDTEYQAGLKDCASRTVFYGGHFAFGYLASRYGLEFISPYTGFSPDAEPSPRVLADLITKMRTRAVKRIYFEELLDPKISRMIAEETGAQAELLHGAHNLSAEEFAKGVTFLSIMKENLQKLREGLQCR